MENFQSFLAEAAEAKLTHISHVEDHPIEDGSKGFIHATHVLHQVKHAVESGQTSHNLSTKYDGSPSIVFGHHPQTGKFFVASKSAFNKEPKINYSESDIEKNHGHAPGLVHALKHALHHLPKITPPKGVFQGDVMHTPDSLHTSGEHSVSFKPNTIMYTAHGTEAEKAKKSKFGVVVHTQYKGKHFESMRAEPMKDHSIFGHHPDVHNISPSYTAPKSILSNDHAIQFEHHIAQATQHHANVDYKSLEPVKDKLKTYLNSTVRTGEHSSLEGFLKHVVTKHEAAIAGVKTEKAKDAKRIAMNYDLSHITKHASSFSSALASQHHLQQAKNILVHHMNSHYSGFEHHIGGKKSNPEGYVFHHKGQLSKLVNRKEFSAANFANARS